MSQIGVANKQYVSAIQLLDKREINPNVLDIHNEEGLTDIAGIAGRYKPTSMASYKNFVADPLFKQIEIGAAPTGAGTKASPLVVVTTAATAGILRKTDAVKFKDGKVGYVIDVQRGAQDTVTIRPVNEGAALSGNAGDKLSLFTNAVGERSTALQNRRYGMTRYENLIQAFREVNEETDIQTMSAIEVKFGGKECYHVKNLADKYILHKASVNAAMIGGSMSAKADGTAIEFGSPSADQIVDPVNGGSTQFTRGLDEYVNLFGITDEVNTPDQVDMVDFEDLIGKLLAAKAHKDLLVVGSTKAKIKVDNTLSGVNNLLSQGRLSLDGKERDFAVSVLKYGTFRMQFGDLPILDNQELFGNTDISKSLYFIPTDKVKVRGGGSEPRLQIRYMKHNIAPSSNKGNEIWGEFHTGGLAPTGATNDELVWRTNWVTYQGLECLGVQHFAKLKVLA